MEKAQCLRRPQPTSATRARLPSTRSDLLLGGAAGRTFQSFDDNENEQQLAGSLPRFLTVPGHYWLVRSSNGTTAEERRDARPSLQA